MIAVNKTIFNSVFVSISILAISFVTEDIFHLIGVILAFYFIVEAKIEYIIGLFFLYFLKGNFFLPSSKIISNNTEGDIDKIESTVGFEIGGFPINVATLACAFISIRVIFEIFTCPSTFEQKVPKYLLYLWLISFIPGIASFIWSYQLGNPNWTRGLRFLMISGSYFYGFIFLKNFRKKDHKKILRIFFPFVTFMLILTYLNAFWSHLSFLFLGIGGAFSFYFYFSKGCFGKLIGVILIFLTLNIGLSSTLTLFLISLLSCILSFLVNIKKYGFKFQNIIKLFSILMIPLSLIFTFIVAYLGFFLNMTFLVDASNQVTITDRVIFKTLIDRLPFWFAAFEQIITGPYFFVPSGRPLYISSVFYGNDFEWVVGAHNSYLETLRNTGILIGVVIILIYLTAIWNNFKVLKHSSSRILQSLAISVITVGLIGMTVGDFPVDMTVGFFLWSIAGVNYGLFLESNASTF
jgi:hypothetical protein